MLERIERYQRQIGQYRKGITAAFFAVILLLGVFLAKDYGMPWDEETEFGILSANLKEYARLLQGEDSDFVRWADERGIVYISEYMEKDHGQSAYYPITPLFVKYSYEDNTRALSLTWHIHTFLVCFLGMLALYGTVRRLTGRRIYGMMGCLMWWLSPRIFADSFYNNKDMMFAAFVLIVLYFALRFIEERKIRHAVLLGITGAFASNTRVLGFWLVGLTGLLYLIILTVKKEWSRRNFLLGLGVVASFALSFLAITPATWPSVVEYFQYVVSNSMNFVRWEGSLMYQGEMFGNSFRTLPWHYLPVLIFLTSPVFVLILMTAGNVLTGFDFLRPKRILDGPAKYYVLMFVFVWPVLAYTIVRDPVIYNGWRHFYFIYGPFVIMGMRAFAALSGSRQKFVRIASRAAAAIQLVCMAVVIVLAHPNEFGYYNILSGGNVEEKYELDYWNVSALSCLRGVLEKADPAPGESIVIGSYEGYSYAGIYRAYKLLTDEEKAQVVLLPEDTYLEADYLFVNPTYREITEKRYEMRLGGYEPFDYEGWGELFYTENCLANRLYLVYQNKDLL